MSDTQDRSDWQVYKRLNRLQIAGVELSAQVLAHLEAIRAKHPTWQLDGTERDEFSVWSESSSGDRGDPGDVADLPTEEILPTIRQRKVSDWRGSSGLWRNFSRSDPLKAFNALRAEYDHGVVDVDEWHQLFFQLREPSSDMPLHEAVLEFLIQTRAERLTDAASAIASWLESKQSKFFELDNSSARILALWDVLCELLTEPPGADDRPYGDIIAAVLNEAPGVLVEVLVDQIELNERSNLIRQELLARFQRAIKWPKERGIIAQCTLLQRLPWLETIFPEWVHDELVPLLNADDKYKIDRWHARFYHDHPGSTKLFSSTKEAFFDTFHHIEEISNDERQVHLLMNAVQFKLQNDKWPIEKAETRQTMLHGGEQALEIFCRILRGRDGAVSSEQHWRKTVKPMLEFMWPMDVNARGRRATLGLLDLIFGTGKCFNDAVKTVVQQLIPVWSMERAWEIDHHFDDDAIDIATREPEALLDLLDKIVVRETPPVKLNLLLDRLHDAQPALALTSTFRSLRGLARRSAA